MEPKAEKSFIREVSARYSGPRKKAVKIKSPSDVWEFALKTVKDNSREHFIALFLGSGNQVVSYSLVALGTANSCPVHPREVFQHAVLVGATSVIVCHNHPSDSPEPSHQDVAVTSMLKDAGKLIGIEVLDHVVFTESDFISLKDRGVFE